MKDIIFDKYTIHITPQHVYIYVIGQKQFLYHIYLYRKKMQTKNPIELECNILGKIKRSYFKSVKNVIAKLHKLGVDVPIEAFDMMNAQLLMKEMIK